MLTCFRVVFYFPLCVCARECERVCMRECAVMGESVYVCMHAHTFCGGAVSTLFRPYRSHFLLGKKTNKHSCCLVTSLWLHIIYYTFLLLCQTFTKYDILFLLVSLCIIQSKMPYLASIFLYRCSITSPY